MGAVFEDMCRAFTLELGLAGAFPGLFTRERIDRNVLDRLRMRDGLIDHRYHTAGWLLFSKSGFTEGVLAQAESEQVRAVTLADLYAAP